MTSLNAIAAAEHRADLQRAANRPPAYPDGPARRKSPQAHVALRPAYADEAGVVRRLAALDEAPDLDGNVLLALIDGEAVAALSLGDGRVVANPFVPTDDAVALLKLRADHLSAVRRRRRWRVTLRPRLA
jgi:hypothetical protein